MVQPNFSWNHCVIGVKQQCWPVHVRPSKKKKKPELKEITSCSNTFWFSEKPIRIELWCLLTGREWFSVIVVFILSALWWMRIGGLGKLPDGRDWLWGKLDLQQLELDMGQQTGSKLGKGYIEAVYCHPAYLNYMWVHYVKCWAGWITSWNKYCQEKYQQPQIWRC